jgi:hypothetical protein
MGRGTQGALEVPADFANGMLRLFLRNLRAGRFVSVQIRVRRPWYGSCSVMERWMGSERREVKCNGRSVPMR